MARFAGRPEPYETGTAEMWRDPYISDRLVELHLDPDVEAASRTEEHVEATVEWISDRFETDDAKILDLGCGPGLYTERFARAGHDVTGVDFSRASIDRAKERAAEEGLDVDYVCADYLDVEYGDGYDLVTMIYCDFGVLSPEERAVLLEKVYDALAPGGVFVFDALNGRALDALAFDANWDVSEGGFWREGPYVCLSESYHYPEHGATVDQDIVVDESGAFEVYRHWNHYFDSDDIERRLEAFGFDDVESREGLLTGGGPFNGEDVTFYAATK